MTHFTAIRYFALLLGLWLVIPGCGSLSKPYPDRAMYAIAIQAPSDAQPGEGRGIVKVTRLRIVAPYDDRTFYYKVGPSEFKSDYYNVFVAPPDRMLTSLLFDYLQDVGGFDLVLPSTSGADCDLRLEGNIRALYADFSEGPVPDAVIEARFFLISLDHTQDKVVAEKTYRQRVKADSGEPEAITKAWGEALTAMYAELASDLTAAVEPNSSKDSHEMPEKTSDEK